MIFESRLWWFDGSKPYIGNFQKEILWSGGRDCALSLGSP
jgi:hypothetical protein